MTSYPTNEPGFPAPGPPYVPGLRTRSQRRQDTGALPEKNVWLATPDGPAPKPEDPDDKLVAWERAVDLIKNVVVIVTCMVILYTLWTVYTALSDLGDRLSQFPL